MADVILIGASVRAAAFSALRAGLRPWCVDLFADRDLAAHCPALRLQGKYPDAFVEALRDAPPAPLVYTGGLENHPRLIACLAANRLLWGNDADALTAVRDPVTLYGHLNSAGFAVPQCPWTDWSRVSTGRWLVKALRSSGGGGVRFFDPLHPPSEQQKTRAFLQEYIEGESRSAVFCASARRTTLLGVTRQLVGEAWLHAKPFHYCGSVGPLLLPQSERTYLERLGSMIAAHDGLRGLFGVDGIWRDGVFWPVEVNPRYTASIEVLEYATGLKAMEWHRRAFETSAPVPAPPSAERRIVGKAILFARDTLHIAEGPWRSALDTPIEEMPAFADIPAPGERMEAGRPVFTLLGRGATVDDCLGRLRQRVDEVERDLYASRPSETGG